MTIPFYEHIRATPVFRPLFIYLLAWVSGYAHPEWLHFLSSELLVLLVALSFLSILFNRIMSLWFQKGFLFFCFIFIGMYQAKPVLIPDFNTEMEVEFLCEVSDYPIEKPKSYLIKLLLIYSFSDSSTVFHPVYINAYFEKTLTPETLPEPGQRLIVKSRLQAVKNNGNPEEFDYASWLKRKNIFYTSFVRSGKWMNTGRQFDNFHYKCLKVRAQMKEKILRYRPGEFTKEKAVLIAISLGSKELLDPEIKSDFADAGAIHVMAVSGLHVGLIWLFIGFITGFLKSSLVGRIMQFLLLMTVLWAYAGVTGMSASVTRSCLMFSLVSFGSLILRQSSVFNTVLLSAFIQILLNPLVVLDTGFQFSYSAVFSILFFQPLIRKILYSKFKILDYIANLISVSIAAQIFTFPLAIFYFHQFPVWFILTNIVVIPLVTALMMTFIISLILLLFPVLSYFSISVLIFLSGIMIRMVENINNLPMTVAESLTISKLQLFLLLISALFLLCFIYYRKLNYIKYFTILLIFFFGIGSWNYNNRIMAEIWVLNVPNALVVDVIYGQEHYLIHNLDSSNIQSKLSYYTENYWVKNYYLEAKYIHISELKESFSSIAFQPLPGENNGVLSVGEKNIVLVGDSREILKYKGNISLENEAVLIFDPDFYPHDIQGSLFRTKVWLVSPACKAYSSWYESIDTMYVFVKEMGAQCIKII